MNFFQRKKLALLFIPLGALGGYLYWNYVGCLSGACALKSNLGYMLLFGGLMGFFLGDWISELREKRKNKEDEENKEDNE